MYSNNNNAFNDIFDSFNQIFEATASDFIHPQEDVETFSDETRKAIDELYVIARKNSTKTVFRLKSGAFVIQDKNTDETFGTFYDVTEAKQALIALVIGY